MDYLDDMEEERIDGEQVVFAATDDWEFQEPAACFSAAVEWALTEAGPTDRSIYILYAVVSRVSEKDLLSWLDSRVIETVCEHLQGAASEVPRPVAEEWSRNVNGALDDKFRDDIAKATKRWLRRHKNLDLYRLSAPKFLHFMLDESRAGGIELSCDKETYELVKGLYCDYPIFIRHEEDSTFARLEEAMKETRLKCDAECQKCLFRKCCAIIDT